MKVTDKNMNQVFGLIVMLEIANSDFNVCSLEFKRLKLYSSVYNLEELDYSFKSSEDYEDFYKSNKYKLRSLIIKLASKMSFKYISRGLESAMCIMLIDGVISPKETEAIEQICYEIGISKRVAKSLINKSIKQYNKFKYDFEETKKKNGNSSKIKEELLIKHFYKDGLMKCFECPSTLETFEIEGIEFDFCNNSLCGIWSDCGEIAEWLLVDNTLMPYYNKDISKLGSKVEKDCLRCGSNEIYEIPFIDNEDLLIDMCNDCRGIWLNHGELKKLQKIALKRWITPQTGAASRLFKKSGLDLLASKLKS